MGFPSDFLFPLLRGIKNVVFELVCINTAICSLLCKIGLMEPLNPQSPEWHFFSKISHVQEAKYIREHLPVTTFGHFAGGLGEIEEEDVICAVCLSSFEEDDEIRELCNCCHIFHKNCVDKWINHHHKTCPLCRSDLIAQPDDLDEEETNDYS
ncbi:hypothetical protein SUGI_1190510 [Cryptomeria japonica]|nr:hypothetical protein SUGI_1190510 [Cryptomeria japonica]